MQIKPLNQNYSHESLGNKALLMQGPCSTSVTSCLSGKSQVVMREVTVRVTCISSVLSFLYTLCTMLKALQGSELAEETTYIASLHSAIGWEKSFPINRLGFLGVPNQPQPPQCLVVQWDRYEYKRHQDLHLHWGLIYLYYFMQYVRSATALPESERDRASNDLWQWYLSFHKLS